jgi:hypothetical protein
MFDTLKELKVLSPRLNKSSDSLNSIVTRVNDTLNELNLGFTVWVSLTSKVITPPKLPRDVETVEAEKCLGYTKLPTGWGLAVMEQTRYRGYFEQDRDCPFSYAVEGDVSPLLDCSRELRIRSIEALPRLFQALKERAEEVIDAVEKARDVASEFNLS